MTGKTFRFLLGKRKPGKENQYGARVYRHWTKDLRPAKKGIQYCLRV